MVLAIAKGAQREDAHEGWESERSGEKRAGRLTNDSPTLSDDGVPIYDSWTFP